MNNIINLAGLYWWRHILITCPSFLHLDHSAPGGKKGLKSLVYIHLLSVRALRVCASIETLYYSAWVPRWDVLGLKLLLCLNWQDKTLSWGSSAGLIVKIVWGGETQLKMVSNHPCWYSVSDNTETYKYKQFTWFNVMSVSEITTCQSVVGFLTRLTVNHLTDTPADSNRRLTAGVRSPPSGWIKVC